MITHTLLTRRQFLKSTATGSLALTTSLAPAFSAPKRKPNVIYIMTDQQRKDTPRCYGNDQVQTPALDFLSRSSVVRAGVILSSYMLMRDDRSTAWCRITKARDLPAF